MAAGFGKDLDRGRHHVGGIAAANHADVAGALKTLLFHPPVPACAVKIGNRQGGYRDGTHPRFRGNTGMAGDSTDVNFHPVSAGRSDRHVFGRAAVEVERQRRLAQHAQFHVSGTAQSDLFLNGPEESQRRVGQAAADSFQRRIEHGRRPRPIVGPQRGLPVRGIDPVAAAHRAGPHAKRNGVHVGHQEPPRSADAPGSLQMRFPVSPPKTLWRCARSWRMADCGTPAERSAA